MSTGTPVSVSHKTADALKQADTYVTEAEFRAAMLSPDATKNGKIAEPKSGITANKDQRAAAENEKNGISRAEFMAKTIMVVDKMDAEGRVTYREATMEEKENAFNKMQIDEDKGHASTTEINAFFHKYAGEDHLMSASEWTTALSIPEEQPTCPPCDTSAQQKLDIINQEAKTRAENGAKYIPISHIQEINQTGQPVDNPLKNPTSKSSKTKSKVDIKAIPKG
jgi:hypothetical protein